MDIVRDKKKIRIIISLLLIICIFLFSYIFYITKYKDSNISHEKTQVNKNTPTNAVSVQSPVESTLSKNGKAVFKVKYKKSGEIRIEKEEGIGSLVGKSKNEIEEAFKDEGYKVEQMNASQVSLIREEDQYSPNKYVLGIKDGFIAIFKTDNAGNMFIEDGKRDITDIKIEKLKSEDIRLLTKGDKYFQCNTREDAKSKLEDYE